MKQNSIPSSLGRSQTRTPVRAKRLDSGIHNQSIQSTAFTNSQIHNSSIDLSVFNMNSYKYQNQSTDSIIFDNNINFTNNIQESSRFEANSQMLIEKYSTCDVQSTIPEQVVHQKAHSSIDHRSSQNDIKNLELLLRPKRRLSPKQKEVNSLIGRICEERLFPILIKECSNAGLITKEQVKEYDIKQHFKQQKAEDFMLGNQPLLNKLNLNSSYNTIGNYTGTNRYLKVNLDYDKLRVDPDKTKITNKQKRIKHFFEGINPAQIKMKVLPPLKPVQLAFQQTEDARQHKKKSYSAHLDSDANQRNSVLSLPTTYEKPQKQFLKNDSMIAEANQMSSFQNLNANQSDFQEQLSDIQQYSNKKQFQLELDSIFSASQIPTTQVYKTDMERFNKRITPTPFKKSFMPNHYKDRIVALNVKY